MRMIFISGPYRASSGEARSQYVRRALEAITTLWNLGAAPVCPSLSALGLGQAIAYEAQVACGREVMLRSDAVYALGPASSAELRRELAAAREKGLPVFERDQLLELRAYLIEDATSP